MSVIPPTGISDHPSGFYFPDNRDPRTILYQVCQFCEEVTTPDDSYLPFTPVMIAVIAGQLADRVEIRILTAGKIRAKF